jgi:transmembrane sensor
MITEMISEEDIQQLALKWLKGTINDDERQQLEDWYNEEPKESYLWKHDKDETSLRNRIRKEIFQKIERQCNSLNEQRGAKRHRKHLYKYAAAVAILLLGMWCVFDSDLLFSSDKSVAGIIDLPPGKEAAALVLSDGSVIRLDSVKDGEIAVQGNAVIYKTGGEVAYSANSDASSNKPVRYNLINTARGNQYRLKLSDGTKVWLNSSSSLHFPTRFEGELRQVELQGEAYFEVAKNKHLPFRVKSGDINIEVLGTHFNVNAYNDEPYIKTTLLEGSVKVSKAGSSILIAPGEQAVVGGDIPGVIAIKVDVEKVMAWQKGFFEFDNTSLPEIMRQISRWYDIDVRFEEEESTKIRYGGRISKTLNLNDILELLQANGILFALDDSMLIVNP